MCALKDVYDCWLFLILLTLHPRGSNSSCAYLKTDGGSVSDTTATLSFSVMYNCIDQTPLKNVKIVQKMDHPPHYVICSIFIVNAKCDATEGCACGSQSQSYSVKQGITQTQTWELFAELQGGEQIQTEVVMIFEQEAIYHIRTSPNEVSTIKVTIPEVGTTPTSTVKVSSSGETFTTQVVLPASMGGILILVLAVLVRMEMMRRRLAGRPRSLPPPPPAPHVFRRPEPDAVAFHIQPDGEDGRVSILSVRDHVYEVMPGEDSTSSGDAFDASDSSSVSLSTTSDASLLHIVCPSTDSSLPEDYLHPVASDEDASSKPEMTGESMTNLHRYPDEMLATPARADPPYENVGNAP